MKALPPMRAWPLMAGRVPAAASCRWPWARNAAADSSASALLAGVAKAARACASLAALQLMPPPSNARQSRGQHVQQKGAYELDTFEAHQSPGAVLVGARRERHAFAAHCANALVGYQANRYGRDALVKQE